MGIDRIEKPGPDERVGPISERSGSGDRRHTARLVLVAFLSTFTFLRIVIFLITLRRLPDMLVYIRGTHVHHLNLGIFLLSFVGAYLLFGREKERKAKWVAVLYGIGLAMTFDEFGMWLHLGGSYWQRASFDAITVVMGFLILMAFGPSVKEIRGKHAVTIVILLLLAAAFFVLLFQTVNKYGGRVKPRSERPALSQSQSEAAAGREETASRQPMDQPPPKAMFLLGRMPLRRQNGCFFKRIADRDPDPAGVSPISLQMVPGVRSQVKEKTPAINEENGKMGPI